MSDALAGAHDKIGRAREHLVELQKRIRILNSTDGNRALVHYDAQQRCHTVQMLVTELPSSDLALVAGDAVYSLRCALDYVIWQLACKFKGREPTEQEAREIQFPISDHHRWFANSKTLRHVSQQAAQELARHQPYAPQLGGKHDPTLLGLLRDLSNGDKHRLLIPRAERYQFDDLSLFVHNPSAIGWRYESVTHDRTPFKPSLPYKSVIGRVYTEPPEAAPETEIKIDAQPSVALLFGGPSHDIGIGGLGAMAECVEYIVSRFDRLV